MALWPFIPSQMSETLSYFTDVRKTRSREYRDSLHNATQILTYYYSTPTSALQSRIEQTFRNNLAGMWEVPLWHFFTAFPSGIAVGASSLTVNDGDYRAGGQALIYQDPLTYEVINIESYSGGVISIPNPELVTRNYAAGTWVVPLVDALVPGGLQRRLAVNMVDFDLTFYTTQGADLAAANYNLQSGYDIVTDTPSINEVLDGGLSQALDFIDNGFGSFAIVTNETYIRWRSTLEFTDVTHADRWARRQHLDRCRGKDRPFFLPTYQKDLTIASPTGATSTSIVVSAAEVPDRAALVGRYILLEGSGFERVVRVTGTSGVSNYTLALDQQAGIALSTGTKLSFAHLVRYDTDMFELEHIRTSDGWYTAYSALVLEVPS